MARFDLNRRPAPDETGESRLAPEMQGRAGSRTGDRKRTHTGVFMGTPKRTNAFWFFVALVGGGAGVWWTKSAFRDPWMAAIVAACVVLALTIYYVLNDEDAPEEEGDNVYYLGLLFTLLSLMFALLELFGADTGGERNTENIRALLENFGIALTSTIVGIAGRVAVQNWQRTGSKEKPEFAQDVPVPALPPGSASSRDIERFNRHLLGRIARDLTQGANALARFHRIVRSHASDTEDHLLNHSESLKRESAAFKDTLQRNAETFAEELRSEAQNTLDAVGGSLGAAAKRAEALLERIESAHDDYLAEVRDVTRSFHDEIRSASGQSLDALKRNFDAAAKQSISLTQNVSAVHEQTAKVLDRLGTGLGDASDASAAFGSSAQQTAKSTEVLGSEIDKLRTALAAVHTGAEAMTGVLGAMGELHARISAGRDTEQTAAAVQQIGETLRTITVEGATASEQAANAAELFNALTQSVRTTMEQTRRATEALRVLADEAEARTDTLRQGQGSGFGFWNRSR